MRAVAELRRDYQGFPKIPGFPVEAFFGASFSRRATLPTHHDTRRQPTTTSTNPPPLSPEISTHATERLALPVEHEERQMIKSKRGHAEGYNLYIPLRWRYGAGFFFTSICVTCEDVDTNHFPR